MAGDWLAPPLAFRSFFTEYLYHKHPETFLPKTIQISSDFSYVIFWHASVACFLKSYVLPFILPLFFSRNRVTPLQIPLFAPQEARHLYWPFRTSCPIKKHSRVDYYETDGDFIFYVFSDLVLYSSEGKRMISSLCVSHVYFKALSSILR